MDRRLATHQRAWRPMIATIVVLVLVVSMGVDATAAASSGCSVKNVATGRTYSTLHAAAKAARPQARLLVRGTCRGKSVITKPMTIHGVTTKRWGKPVLDGAGRTRVLVVTRKAKVEVLTLTVRNGEDEGRGGGILNRGSLDLRGVVVRDNYAGSEAGGIWNVGRLSLYGRASVVGNSVGYAGGVCGLVCAAGILNQGTLVMNGASRVSRNAGMGVFNMGWMVMNGASRVSRNGLPFDVRSGGGVLNYRELTMNARSRITGNRAAMGGGVYNLSTFTMNGASRVARNRATSQSGRLESSGGGVYNAIYLGRRIPTFTMNDMSAVIDNRADYDGGGVLNSDIMVMNGASHISGNAAGVRGGGIFWDSTAALSTGVPLTGAPFTGVRCGPGADANVYENAPDDCVLTTDPKSD